MFEFDEHFDDLEAMQSELELSQNSDSDMLPAWSYIGSDVWKLDFDAESLEIPRDWRLQTVDMV
ncbi:MAG: hypothetical protein GC179_28610 [Anaerolineaceae bacterium]|nr:hypothetical protein [Anaerolineaceae bacterium]